jgi:PAS domain-containing protein
MTKSDGRGLKSHGSLAADIIIANAPDPVFVSDLEGKIVQANDAVSQPCAVILRGSFLVP